MKTIWKIEVPALLWAIAFVAISGGCNCWDKRTPTPPLGTHSDAIWKRQEAGASASDFVIYQHEFEKNGTRLNMAGEDHLRSIAARLHCGAPVPVIVERSMTHIKPSSEYKYPVNPDFELDRRRRESIVGTLIAMGIPNADQIVVVAPPLAEGMTATEASAAYYQGMTLDGQSNINRNNNFGTTNPVNTGIGNAGTMNSDQSYSASTSPF